MAKLKWGFFLVMFIIPILTGNKIQAGHVNDNDKTLSPYFFVISEDPEVDRLPLKSTSIKANISGIIADIEVTQVYKNEGGKPIEAIYIFPASTRAAVYGMKMTIGERTIVAEIRKSEEAREEYDQAKKSGRSASLLEQHRPNVFQMNVANILPSDIIKVNLKYTELLVPTDKIYEFVYPTVVGPRYTEMKCSESRHSESWTANPYLHEGEPPNYSFDIDIILSAGLPIKKLGCSSHKVDIEYKGLSSAIVRLDQSEKHGGNRDYILRYMLAGKSVETGLLLYEGENENFFLLMLQPPETIKRSQMPAREYIFIVDVSGSMHGFPLNISKRLLRDLVGQLRPEDRFNVILFAGGSKIMSPVSLKATEENIKNALNLIDRQRGGGGTSLLPALKRALSLPEEEGCSRTIVIATDGFVSVEAEAFDLIRNNLGRANVFTFGIGSSVNRYLIEGMARVGMGEPFVVTTPDEAPGSAERFRKLIEFPFLTDIKMEFNGFDVHDVEPKSIPDLMGERPVIIFGKYRGLPKGNIEMEAISGGRPLFRKIKVKNARPVKGNSALKYLWARHRISLLSDLNNIDNQTHRKREITDLGLEYNLLTAYTSFVAVDKRARKNDGQTVTVKQPLPLPHGVSDYAVSKGGPQAARMSLRHPGLAPSSAEGDSLLVEKENFPVKEAKAKSEIENTGKVDGKERIRLGKIRSGGGIREDFLKRLLERHFHLLKSCCESEPSELIPSNQSIVFNLVISGEGRVVKVEAEKGKNMGEDLKNCIAGFFKSMKFPQPGTGHSETVVVELIFR